MRIVKTGVTRWVLLTKKYAIKFPSLYSYRHFLQGILGNEQECFWYRNFKWTKKLCPVLWKSWGYFVIIMPKVRVMTDEEATQEWGWKYERSATLECFETPLDKFLKIEEGEDSIFPAEKKSDSFGWLDGRIVIIDYGS